MLSIALTKLDSLLSHEFQKRLLSAAIQSFYDEANPLAFNNFCTGFRELVRHVLSDLAPDTEIRASPWYTPDSTARNGITRAHAISYLVQGGLTEEYLSTHLDIEASGEKQALLDAVNRLSKFTHVNESTFDTDRVAAEARVHSTVNSLISVLELAHTCREMLATALSDQIEKSVVEIAIGETIDVIDELATHHYIDAIEVEEIEVTKIGAQFIHFCAAGTICVVLQWGSGSDVRRGDGATMEDSYPFVCHFQSRVTSPMDLEIESHGLNVDTSSWWEE